MCFIQAIEREVEHLRMLMAANERYEAEPEANDGETNQTDDAQTNEN